MKLILTFLFALSSLLYSQELNCTVTLNSESLPVESRDRLSDFGDAVENYINQTRFTDDSWEYPKINCAFSIFVTSASDETHYQAQIVVTSQRQIYKSNDNSLMLSINDNAWNFEYLKGQPLNNRQSIFDPITGLLNYYAYIILGFDADSWDELGGTVYFTDASDIVNLGATSNFKTGWERNSSSYSRSGLVNDLLNEKYRPFREAIYGYYYGIDIYSKNKTEGQAEIAKLVNALVNLKTKIDLTGVFVKVFFDAKYGEIIDRLKGYPDKTIFEKLKKIDPAHIAKYDQALSNG
ncbi:MAG TPA: DUF4835 family protein [Ignavibacteriaceae bacterium]|nr:DUF4835 family protein [Ignavibacteriaceae bacterium]